MPLVFSWPEGAAAPQAEHLFYFFLNIYFHFSVPLPMIPSCPLALAVSVLLATGTGRLAAGDSPTLLHLQAMYAGGSCYFSRIFRN